MYSNIVIEKSETQNIDVKERHQTLQMDSQEKGELELESVPACVLCQHTAPDLPDVGTSGH